MRCLARLPRDFSIKSCRTVKVCAIHTQLHTVCQSGNWKSHGIIVLLSHHGKSSFIPDVTLRSVLQIKCIILILIYKGCCLFLHILPPFHEQPLISVVTAKGCHVVSPAHACLSSNTDVAICINIFILYLISKADPHTVMMHLRDTGS